MSVASGPDSGGHGDAGTLIGLRAAEVRWRRERRAVPGEEYEKRRRDAYAELWFAVEDAAFEARVAMDAFDAKRAADLTLTMNRFLLRNAPYISDADRDWVERYLRAVLTVVESVRTEGTADERELVQSTVAFPDDFGPRVTKASRALTQVATLRDELRASVKSTLGGTPPAFDRQG